MGALLNQANQSTGKVAVRNHKSITSDTGYFQEKWNMANNLSMSSFVPQQFKGKPADCMIAMEVAEQMRMPFFTVIQNLDIIHGKTSWKSAFVISAINASKRYASNMMFDFTGVAGQDNWGCRAYVIDNNGEKLYGTMVTMQMAKSEGWTSKKGSKWQTMPELMMQYRAASFFSRVHAPDLLMGMQSSDEIVDVEPVSKETIEASNAIPETIESNEDVKMLPEQSKDDAEVYTFEDLLIDVEAFGFTVSGPTEAANGQMWLKAEALDESADTEALMSLGFKDTKKGLVMNVTSLLEGVQHAS